MPLLFVLRNTVELLHLTLDEDGLLQDWEIAPRRQANHRTVEFLLAPALAALKEEIMQLI